MQESLIVAADTEQPWVQATAAELDSHDVLRVTSVAIGNASFSAWVPKYVDEAVVIAGGNVLLAFVHVHAVDVGAVTVFWEDTIDIPAKLAVLRGPQSRSRVRGTRWILSAGRNLEEEKLVAVTD